MTFINNCKGTKPIHRKITQNDQQLKMRGQLQLSTYTKGNTNPEIKLQVPHHPWAPNSKQPDLNKPCVIQKKIRQHNGCILDYPKGPISQQLSSIPTEQSKRHNNPTSKATCLAMYDALFYRKTGSITAVLGLQDAQTAVTHTMHSTCTGTQATPQGTQATFQYKFEN